MALKQPYHGISKSRIDLYGEEPGYVGGDKYLLFTTRPSRLGTNRSDR